MSSGEEREGSHVGSGIPEGRVLPLNSRRLVARQGDSDEFGPVDESLDRRSPSDGGGKTVREPTQRPGGYTGA